MSTRGHRVAVVAAAFLSVSVAASAQETGTEGQQNYLPAWVYPAVYAFGGMVQGPSYDAAPIISGYAAEYGLAARLEDIGRMPAVGVAFEYYFWRGMSADVKVTHEVGARRETSLSYVVGDFPAFDPSPFYHDPIDETLSYKFQNVDVKVSLGYLVFPDWRVSPYGGAGLGVNSSAMKITDRVSDPVIQKWNNGLLLSEGWFQRYSFDWAVYAGVHVNLVSNLFARCEYVHDGAFGDHFFANYRYHTGLDGVYAGLGWRFISE